MNSSDPYLKDAHPTANWTLLHDRFYRKIELYSMMWSMTAEDLSKCQLYGCPYGGLIAVVYRPSPKKRMLFIYSSTGNLVMDSPWAASASAVPDILACGWTRDDRLICVFEDATFRVYEINGDFKQYSLGQEATERGVRECKIIDGAIVLMTNDFRFIVIDQVDEPHPKLLAEAPFETEPTSWQSLSAEVSLSRSVEVLVAADQTVYQIDSRESQKMATLDGCFMDMAIAPNGKLVALYTEEGTLSVHSADFHQKLLEFPTRSSVKPTQLAWCGNDSVLVLWEEILLMMGPYGEWAKYSFDGTTFLVTELDGVRIFSCHKCEFLERVSDETEDIFKIGSTKASAMLYDALDSFEKHNPKADEIIRTMKHELSPASERCISAASKEFDVRLQKAAAFGQAFLSDRMSETFTQMCKTLRVLNALRHYEVAMPLTHSQFMKLGIDRAIRRLLKQNRHFLAIRICEYMNMKTDFIVNDWAQSVIKQSKISDVELCSKLIAKLGSQRNASFAEIAKIAFERGRPNLAAKLLDYEKRPSEQVPLLLSMQEYEVALEKAVESRNGDLVNYVLLALRRQLQLADFFKLISKHQSSVKLFEGYARARNINLLKDFYYQDDRRYEQALLNIHSVFSNPSHEEKIAEMKGLVKTVSDAKQTFLSNVVSVSAKLSKTQLDLEKEMNESFRNLSVNEIIKKLIILKQSSRANKIKSEFRVPEKIFYYIKIRTLCETGEWEELDKFCRSKKSPVGYVPFVLDAIMFHNTLEAKKYILKCDPADRPMLYLKLGASREAAEAAFSVKDVDVLRQIRDKERNSTIIHEINRMILQLGFNE